MASQADIAAVQHFYDEVARGNFWVGKEIFDRPDGRSEAKVLLHFKAFRKPLPCNKTNALNLASAYGKNPADWVGKPVLVKTEPTSFGGKPTKGVRVYPADPNDMKGDHIPFDR